MCKRLRGPIRSTMSMHQPAILVVLVAVIQKASKAYSFYDVFVQSSTSIRQPILALLLAVVSLLSWVTSKLPVLTWATSASSWLRMS